MKLSAITCAAALAAVAAPCLAASPWDGTWKYNESKSKITGSTFSVEKSGGMYTMHTGAIVFRFACDGKDYPVLADRTTSCKEEGLKATTVAKASGKVLSTTEHVMAADGKSIVDTTTGTRPDGTSYTEKESYVRVAGSGTGLAGTWKNTKSSDSAPSILILKVNGNVLHSENPGYKEVIDAKLDGTPAPIVGPTAPKGLMLSNEADGPMKIVSVVTLNGKEMGRDVMTFAADGKTMIDVSWSPGKESEKQTYFYEKQ